MTDTGATTPVKLLRRRRGVIAGSITRLNTRLRELQDTRTATPEQARLFLAKLNGLDAEYRELHMQVIDKTEDDHRLEAEQDTLTSYQTEERPPRLLDSNGTLDLTSFISQ